jgi:hypothetical protein
VVTLTQRKLDHQRNDFFLFKSEEKNFKMKSVCITYKISRENFSKLFRVYTLIECEKSLIEVNDLPIPLRIEYGNEGFEFKALTVESAPYRGNDLVCPCGNDRSILSLFMAEGANSGHAEASANMLDMINMVEKKECTFHTCIIKNSGDETRYEQLWINAEKIAEDDKEHFAKRAKESKEKLLLKKKAFDDAKDDELVEICYKIVYNNKKLYKYNFVKFVQPKGDIVDERRCVAYVNNFKGFNISLMWSHVTDKPLGIQQPIYKRFNEVITSIS